MGWSNDDVAKAFIARNHKPRKSKTMVYEPEPVYPDAPGGSVYSWGYHWRVACWANHPATARTILLINVAKRSVSTSRHMNLVYFNVRVPRDGAVDDTPDKTFLVPIEVEERGRWPAADEWPLRAWERAKHQADEVMRELARRRWSKHPSIAENQREVVLSHYYARTEFVDELRTMFGLDVLPYEPPTDPKLVRAAMLGRI
jgi:hypothetical protein